MQIPHAIGHCAIVALSTDTPTAPELQVRTTASDVRRLVERIGIARRTLSPAAAAELAVIDPETAAAIGTSGSTLMQAHGLLTQVQRSHNSSGFDGGSSGVRGLVTARGGDNLTSSINI